jgi:membrane-bound ClpP family serine protease
VTTTRLTPGGKARFGDDLVDVISDSELIEPSTPVSVVQVIGNRVLVRTVAEGRGGVS